MFKKAKNQSKRINSHFYVLFNFISVLLFIFLITAPACKKSNINTQNNDRSSTSTQIKADQSQEKTKKETTIRNISKETVLYSIKPHDSDEAPVEKSLEVGDIDRYPGNIDLDITFTRTDKKVTYKLDTGEPYSFRLNENDELELYEGSHGREDAVDLAPYVVTPMYVVERMLALAEVDSRDIVYDIGCGDGRIVITAARKYGARGVGIDLDARLIEESRAGAKEAGVEHLLEFRLEDATKSNISQATVVTMYLLPESNELLRPILERQLKPGTRIVSHGYAIPGWKEKLVNRISLNNEFDEPHLIYLYIR